jgi:hypothetical protein
MCWYAVALIPIIFVSFYVGSRYRIDPRDSK